MSSLSDTFFFNMTNPIGYQAEMIKGTAGKYGVCDYFRVLKLDLKYYIPFRSNSVEEARHQQCYHKFHELKKALSSTAPDRIVKIKSIYDALVQIARSSTWNQPIADAALMKILNDELSEKVTQSFLHEIQLSEWKKEIGEAKNLFAVVKLYGSNAHLEEDFIKVAGSSKISNEQLQELLSEIKRVPSLIHIVRRICEARADFNIEAFQTELNGIDPVLRKNILKYCHKKVEEFEESQRKPIEICDRLQSLSN